MEQISRMPFWQDGYFHPKLLSCQLTNSSIILVWHAKHSTNAYSTQSIHINQFTSGPSIKYVMQFLTYFDPSLPCHTLSHIWEPPKILMIARLQYTPELCKQCSIKLQLYSGASIPSQAMMHSPPVSDFPPYFRQIFWLSGKFLKCDLFPNKFPIFIRQNFWRPFLFIDHKFRISPLFSLF